jgi:hypothetical protein
MWEALAAHVTGNTPNEINNKINGSAVIVIIKKVCVCVVSIKQPVATIDHRRS